MFLFMFWEKARTAERWLFEFRCLSLDRLVGYPEIIVINPPTQKRHFEGLLARPPKKVPRRARIFLETLTNYSW